MPQIISLIFIVGCLVGVFLIYLKREKSFFNSPSLFAISIFCVVTSNLLVGGVNNYNVPFLSLESYGDILLYYSLGAAGFFSVWIVLDSILAPVDTTLPHVTHRSPDDLAKYDIFILGGFYIALGLTIYKFQEFPLLNMILKKTNINQVDELSKKLVVGHLAFLHAFGQLICFRVSYLTFQKNKSWFLYGVYLFALFLACFWGGKRQLFLIFVFSLLAWENAGQKISWKRIASYIGGVIAIGLIFSFINYVRYPSTVTHTSSIIFGYYGWPFLNTYSAIEHCKMFTCHFGEYFTLSEILPARMGGKETLQAFTDGLHEPTSPSGYFLYWFLDFGYWGVFVGGFLLGIVSYCFHRMRNYGTIYYYADILVMYCCITVFVYSHFITTVYFILPVLLLMFVRFLNRLHQEFLGSKF